jgi:DNA-binding protein HU-beta
MNKTELIEKISEKSELNKADADRALNSFVEVVTEALQKKEKVQVTGFGTFKTRERKARKGRNPQKPEEEIEIPASTVATFKAGKTLKDAVNK